MAAGAWADRRVRFAAVQARGSLHYPGPLHTHRAVAGRGQPRLRARRARHQRAVNGTSAAAAGAPVRAARVALIGNPNTGKTTLFNALCGARARTSNYPGTTTTVRTGTLDRNDQIEVVDVPGLYDLHHNTPEMRVARSVLDAAGRGGADVVVVALDAANLTRNLVL